METIKTCEEQSKVFTNIIANETPELTHFPSLDSRLNNIEKMLLQTISYLQKQETSQTKVVQKMQTIEKRLNNVENSLLKKLPISIIYRLNFSILTHCNLNCRGCSHFAPLADKHIVSTDVIKNDLFQMAKITNGSVTLLHFYGGEPLLHPNLKEIIKDARQAFPNTKIKVVTNGVLLPSQDEAFWVVCSENDIELSVTKYPINLNFEKIEQTALKYNVEYTYFRTSGKVEKTLQKYQLDIQGDQDPRKNFGNCCMPYHCNTVREGRIYYCPVISNSGFFNKKFKTNMMIDKRDYLDIYSIESYDQLLNFLATPKPFCKYCDTKKRKEGLTWELSKRKMSEWV